MFSKTKKVILICTFSAFLIIGLFLVLFEQGFLSSDNNNKIAFYRVSPAFQTTVIDILNINLNSSTEKKQKPFEAIILDDNLSLEAQKKLLKNCATLIYINDFQTSDFLENNLAKPVELSFAGGFPSSIVNSLNIKKSGKNEDSIKIIPFLYDFYEIDVNYAIYNQTGMKSLEVWNDLMEAAFLEKKLTKSPLIFAGADDKEFLNVIGLICEALCGYEAYEKMIKHFNLETALMEDQPLGITIKEINGLLNSGIVPKETLKFYPDDILFYMNYELNGMSFLKLSQHRSLSHSVANKYTSIYCPSKEFTTERKFASEQYSISLLIKNDKTTQLLKQLTDSLQAELATRTGLAPVQKNCAVPDHQADDVRFWLAASSGPVMPFANIFPTDLERKNVAQQIRNTIGN